MPQHHPKPGVQPSLGDLAEGLSMLPSDRRESLARQTCGDDPPALARLLDAISDDAQRSLETQIRDLLGPRSTEHPAPAVQAAADDPVGASIGPYHVSARLGEGGFGVVYAAEQDHPIRRTVAIKLIKAGMDTRRVVARFEAERQALARMDHPNIARVLDAGATPLGRPYFVMERVDGIPITAFADRARLTTADRLRLLLPVCDAVQHAHHKGIVHRDLKPANVLVAAGPDGTPVPKVIDFGVAKALHGTLADLTLYTEARQLVGTPAYMSPEQITDGRDIDTRADVYALGVLLYELLASRPPFDIDTLASASAAELERTIRDVNPPRPSTRAAALSPSDRAAAAAARSTTPSALAPALAGDLDCVVMKAIDKDRARRYETPAALAADVRRVLEGLPVQARNPSRIYLVRTFVRRHRAPVLAGAVTAAAILALLIATALGFASASRARDDLVIALDVSHAAERRANDAAELSRRRQYAGLMQAAYQMFAAGDALGCESLLDRAPADVRGWEWRYLAAALTDGSPTLSRDAVDALATFDRLATALAGPSQVPGAFAGLVAGPRSAPVRIRSGPEGATLGREDTRDEVILADPYATGMTSACVSPDGRFIAMGFSNGAVKIRPLRWSPADTTGEQLSTVYFGLRAPVTVAWTADATRIVARASDGAAREWPVGAGSGPFRMPAASIRSGLATCSTDGLRVYTASWYDVTAYDAREGWPLWITNLPEPIALAFDVDSGARVLAFSATGPGRWLLDARTGTLERSWPSADSAAPAPPPRALCALHLDDHRAALGLADGSVAIVNTRTWAIERSLRCTDDPAAAVRSLARAPDDALIALVQSPSLTDQPSRVVILDRDLAHAAPLPDAPPDVTAIAVAPTADLLVAGTRDGRLQAWSIAARALRWQSRTLRPHAITTITFPGWNGSAPAPENPRILVASEVGTLTCLDADSGEMLVELLTDLGQAPRLLTLTDDGQSVLLSTELAGVIRLDTAHTPELLAGRAAARRAYRRTTDLGTLHTAESRAQALSETPGLTGPELEAALRYSRGIGDHYRRLNSDALLALVDPRRTARPERILAITTLLVDRLPDVAGILSTHAWACLNAGRADDARAACTRTINMLAASNSPPFAETLFILALARLDLGDVAGARQALADAEAILATDPSQRDVPTTWLLVRTRAALAPGPTSDAPRQP